MSPAAMGCGERLLTPTGPCPYVYAVLMAVHFE